MCACSARHRADRGPAARRLPRSRGLAIVHTKECHAARPVRLPAGQARARPPARCASATGPDGPHPDRRRAGQRLRAEPCAAGRRNGDRQAGQGRLLCHDLQERTAEPRHHPSARHRCDDRSLRANDDARGQRPRLRVPAGRRRHGKLLPRVQAGDAGDGAAQGGIVGWTATSAQVLAALA